MENESTLNSAPSYELDSRDMDNASLEYLLRAYTDQDLANPACDEVVDSVKQICEQSGYAVKVKRSNYHERGPKFRRCLLRHAIFVCRRGESENGEPCPYEFVVRGYVLCDDDGASDVDIVHPPESTPGTKTEGISYGLRLNLWPSEIAHNHQCHSSTLSEGSGA